MDEGGEGFLKNKIKGLDVINLETGAGTVGFGKKAEKSEEPKMTEREKLIKEFDVEDTVKKCLNSLKKIILQRDRDAYVTRMMDDAAGIVDQRPEYYKTLEGALIEAGYLKVIKVEAPSPQPKKEPIRIVLPSKPTEKPEAKAPPNPLTPKQPPTIKLPKLPLLPSKESVTIRPKSDTVRIELPPKPTETREPLKVETKTPKEIRREELGRVIERAERTLAENLKKEEDLLNKLIEIRKKRTETEKSKSSAVREIEQELSEARLELSQTSKIKFWRHRSLRKEIRYLEQKLEQERDRLI